MLVDCDLDGRVQLDFLKGFDEIGERTGTNGALDGLDVAMAGQEDHGHMRVLLDQLGGLDAVDVSAQADVHDDQLRPQLGRHANGLNAFACDAEHAITEFGDGLFEVASHDAFVFDQQDGDRFVVSGGFLKVFVRIRCARCRQSTEICHRFAFTDEGAVVVHGRTNARTTKWVRSCAAFAG